MKIRDLEDHIGEKVYFSLDESVDGTGDRYDVYFDSLDEAKSYASGEFNHLTDREKQIRIISVCSGIVNPDGYVSDYNEEVKF